jgi:hypothetical protein
MSATTFVVVYNTSSDNIVVDDAGHSVDPQSWRSARRSYVRDHIDNSRLIVVDIDTIGDDSNAAARLAKEEVISANEEIDAAKKSTESKDTKATASKATVDKTSK